MHICDLVQLGHNDSLNYILYMTYLTTVRLHFSQIAPFFYCLCQIDSIQWNSHLTDLVVFGESMVVLDWVGVN